MSQNELSNDYNKLSLIKGNLINKEFILNQKEFSFGRSNDNTIVLDDKAVSNKHTVITVSYNECILKDLGSTNGTFINNIPVKGEQVINHGDIIQIGPFAFKFIDKNPPPNKSSKTVIALLALVILVVFAGSILIGKSSMDVKKVPKLKDSEIENNMANEFFKNNLWETAISKYEIVLKKDPNFKGVSEKIEKAKYEQKNHTIMEEGMTLLANNNLKEGIAKLETIPNNSCYYNEVIIEIQIAKNKIEKSSKETAVTNKSDVVVSSTGTSGNTVNASGSSSTGKSGASGGSGTGVGGTPQQVRIAITDADKVIEEAIQYYKNGNVAMAIARLNYLASDSNFYSVATSINDRIKKVQKLSIKSDKEYENNGLETALPLWKQIMDLDSLIIKAAGASVSKGGSYFVKRISAYLEAERKRNG